jgi:glycosyltransferase involved in cell wall biosynthesis
VSARPLRLGIDARELLGRPTGVGRYLAELLARWTRDPACATTTLVLYAPAALDLPWLGEGGAGVERRTVPGGTGTRWEQLDLPRAAGRDGLDVFFAPAYTAPLRLPTPIAVAMHDVSFAARPQWFRWREGLRRRWLARASARRAAVVITFTEWSRSEIVDHLGVPESRVRVVAHGVDTHPAVAAARGVPPARAASPERLVLHVGSIFNRRHVPALLRGFALVARELPAAQLAVVGENRSFPHEDLAGLVAALGLQSRVTLHDYVPEAVLEALYARARAFAFLSEYEGFGLTPLEAMSRGVPAVLLDTPVARETCGGAAVYVPGALDRAALRDALLRLLTDDAYHAARVEAGRRRAAAFSWDRAARETFDVLTACG